MFPDCPICVPRFNESEFDLEVKLKAFSVDTPRL
jgi:hypothetical protein